MSDSVNLSAADGKLSRFTLGRLVLQAALVALLCQLIYQYMPFVRIAENWLADFRTVALQHPSAQSENLVILTITEETLASLPYRSPIDRRLLQETLIDLENRGVRAVGYDLLFDTATEAGRDQAFFTSLQQARVPIVVAWAEEEDGVTERQLRFLSEQLTGLPRGLPIVLEDAHDKKVRNVVLRRVNEAGSVPGFSAALAGVLNVAIPESDSLILRFRKGPAPGIDRFRKYPLHTLHLLPDDWFRDKVVMIGVDLPNADRFQTPFSSGSANTSSGIELHAHALSQLMDNDIPQKLKSRDFYLLLFLCALMGFGIAVVSLHYLIKLVVSLVFLGLLWGGGALLYTHYELTIPLLSPTLAFGLALGGEGLSQWQKLVVRRQFILNAFGKYLSREVIAELLLDSKQLKLSGEKREMTFLFTDIAGFTALTEKIDPEQLVRLLNGYLSLCSEIVLRHGGTIDKIVGDALHVIFNAPLQQPDHARRAVDCALELDKACESFRQRMQTQGIILGITRIGINTGDCIVGNFGSELRFDYTAHGDAINTAARLENANKATGTRILVSKSTRDQYRQMSFRSVGDLRIRGKTRKMMVYEPLPESALQLAWLERYEDAYAMMSSDTDESLRLFKVLLAENPSDSLLCLHCERLEKGDRGSMIDLSSS